MWDCLDSSNCIKRSLVHLPTCWYRGYWRYHRCFICSSATSLDGYRSLLSPEPHPPVCNIYLCIYLQMPKTQFSSAGCRKYVYEELVDMRAQLPSPWIHDYILASKFQHLNLKPAECELPHLKPSLQGVSVILYPPQPFTGVTWGRLYVT